MNNENVMISKTLEKLRLLKENANENDTVDAIPYTSNDSLLGKMTKEAEEILGAVFKSDTPLLYYQEDGDVTLSGEIKKLDTPIIFQFRLNDSCESGIHIWTDSLSLSQETIKFLSTMNGVGINWKHELNKTRKDLAPISIRKDDNSTQNISETVPGDDLPENPNGFQNGDDI